MFTGIIEEIGTIKGIRRSAESCVLTVQGSIIFNGLRPGDSIAVSGVCLTVSSCSKDDFSADVMHETLSRSSLGSLKTGSRVNLERAVPANGRFGGHIVSGHIDGTGVITKIHKDGNAVWYTISADEGIVRYIVEKGSIAIDGVSLTVTEVTAGGFRVSIIPYTAKSTILSEKITGSSVNLENDLVGKYVEKLVRHGQAQKTLNGITQKFLAEFGY